MKPDAQIEWLRGDVDDFFDRLEELMAERGLTFRLIELFLEIERFAEDDVDKVLKMQIVIITHYASAERQKGSTASLTLGDMVEISEIISDHYEYLGFHSDCRGRVVSGVAALSPKKRKREYKK